MNKIRLKLTSQSGASITYALLLFLVCAVVSSIVLAAGTAASGRISNSVSTDQRYYSVTSAAELLEDLYDGVKVVTQTTKVGSADATMDRYYPKYYKGTETLLGNNYKILEEAAKNIIGLPPEVAVFPLDLEVKVGSDKNADLLVKYVPISSGDEVKSGRLIFTISSYDPDNDKDNYRLYLVFDADVDQTEDKKTKDIYEAGSIKQEETIKTTTEIIWTLTSMGTTNPEG